MKSFPWISHSLRSSQPVSDIDPGSNPAARIPRPRPPSYLPRTPPRRSRSRTICASTRCSPSRSSSSRCRSASTSAAGSGSCSTFNIRIPAGLKIVSRDIFWRAVYDKVPPPPPNHVRGKDSITIHEDTDGDGVFDKHTSFSTASTSPPSVAHGRGGVWVLNPPYLLFYPTKNNDDMPTAIRSFTCRASASKTRTPSPTACAGGPTAGSTAPRAAPSPPTSRGPASRRRRFR